MEADAPAVAQPVPVTHGSPPPQEEYPPLYTKGMIAAIVLGLTSLVLLVVAMSVEVCDWFGDWWGLMVFGCVTAQQQRLHR